MNFHKTIGFLAALLLMVGLGAPDSFAQTGTTTLEFDRTAVDAETAGTAATGVKVTVTLNPAPDAETTVAVTVTVPGDYQITEDAETDSDTTNDGVQVAVLTSPIDVVVGTDGTGESVLIEVVDNGAAYDGLSRLTASVGTTTADVGGTSTTYSAYQKSIPIRDVQRLPSSTQSITLEVRGDPIPSLNANDGSTQEVLLTVTLANAPGAVDGTDVTVSVDISGILVATNGSETPITASSVDISGDDTENETATITLPANSAEGTLIVYAGAPDYRTDEIEIPVINRNAVDVQGFRVVIASPGDKQWVGIGDKVEVHVMRVSRHAYDWTRFTSIAVSLRDTTDTGTDPGPDDDYTELAGVNDTGGDPIIGGTVTATNLNAARDGTIETDNDDVTSDGDTLVFTLELGEDDNVTPTAQDYKGVYAVATFVSATLTTNNTLSSNDAKTDVFTDASLLAGVPAADKKVGDGNLIQVDVVRPPDSDQFTLADLTVTVEGDPVTRNTKVKVGDEIEAKLAVSGAVRFRGGDIRLAIIPVDAAAAMGRDKTFASDTFDADDIADAADSSLDLALDVEEGTFELKAVGGPAANRGYNRNTGKRLGNNNVFEVDGLPIVVRINTIDQAGNVSETGVSSVAFTGDSRKPKISVIHPASGDHFSALYENERDLSEFDEFLMPLVVRVDETDLKELYIFAPGAGRTEADDKVDLLASDISDTVGRAETSVGDTLAYNTSALLYPNPLENRRDELIGGAAITLRVVAIDASDNKTVMNISNVTHDENPPALTNWFPKQSLLEEEDDGTYLINNVTRHPTLTLPEDVDSISVTYDARGRASIVEPVSGMTDAGDKEITITKALEDGVTYTLTMFTRDLAGNVAISGEEELTFSSSFPNPMPGAFKVTNMTGNDDPEKASAGVIAGQSFKLKIQAIDDSGAEDRNVYTYKNEVRISASSSSVRFSGGGVDDNSDGTATLDAAGWSTGMRTVYAKSEKVLDDIDITVEQLDAADMAVLDGSIEDLYVDAADFAGFRLTANEEDADNVEDVWGSFDLIVVPVDAFDNPSVKAFKDDPGSVADTLKLLDAEVVKNNNPNFNYTDGIRVTFSTRPRSLEEDLPFDELIPLAGEPFEMIAPDNRRTVSFRVTVDNGSLEDMDTRSQDISSSESFNVVAPLMPTLTLWGPGGEDLTDAEEIEIPADPGSITVTVTAEGYADGSTITINGEVADDGSAMLTVTEAGDVTVSAMADGRFPVSKTWTFTDEPDEPMRMIFNTMADGSGDPVYLIDLTDNKVDSGDFTLFRAAWGKSASDDINGDGSADDTDVQIFLQSDIHPEEGDGMVNSLDYALFITSWNKTAANGPASKPIVLLPGINENAEFSLNLGSERVVAGELVAVDVSLANVEALVSYGFTLNYDTDKFEFVSVAPADEDLLTSTGGESMLFHNMLADGQIEVVNGVFNGAAVSGGGDIVRFVFRVLYEFEDNARFEIANGLVFDPTHLTNPAVVAGVLELQSTPREFALHQNFPNPFNPDTTIKYDLAESADITLQIYNVLGQVVRTLVASEAQNAGRYQIRWNGMDDRGVPVSSGVYFYQISAEGKFQQVQKLMLLK